MAEPYYGKGLKDELIGNILTSDNSANITKPWNFTEEVNFESGIVTNSTSTFHENVIIADAKNLILEGGSIYAGNIEFMNASGVAYRAKYADFAEYYEADKNYEPGTIVSIGGEKEITLAQENDKVFGVISTNPAYICNASLKDDSKIVLPVCCVGRVPCLIIGKVNKGDKIVLDKDGIGRAMNDNDNINHITPIGISLSNKESEKIEKLEIISRIIL